MTEAKDTDRLEEVVRASPFTLDPSDPAYAGQAAYTPKVLRAYDLVVVKISNTWVWRCPAREMQRFVDRHLAGTHLEIGPGTGYYLDHGQIPARSPRITLLDPNAEVLAHAGHRLRRYAPALHRANALVPIDLEPGSFGSAGLGFVLHCLPGDMAAKAVVFDNVIPLVRPGGVVFGTTILHGGVDQTRRSRRVLRLYNRKGIFSNVGDDLDGLRCELAERFPRYDVEVVGSVALFAGWTA
jgi:SAM-dependent methyltransferase